jgi:hypothetical protein
MTFADKKRPSPWLTFLVLWVQRRIAHAEVLYAKK